MLDPKELLALIDGHCLRPQRLHAIISRTPPSEFKDFLAESRYAVERVNFAYYLWLFQGTKAIETLLNHPHLPIEILERVVLFARIREPLRKGTSQTLKESYPFIHASTSLKLIKQSSSIGQDIGLLIQLLANLTLEVVDALFRSFDTPESALTFFLNIFQRAESDDMQVLLFRNPDLCLRIFSLFELFQSDPDVGQILEQHRQKANELSELKATSLQIARLLDSVSDSTRSTRCNILVSELGKVQNLEQGLLVLDEDRIFANPEERKIVATYLRNSKQAFSTG